ncbi:Protein of unknown function [Lishizhenia tianjinensis]|uniref:DUF4199 domain-containing protein n=1 Tax=Lishizhenia tianjinensis TaxID=477690 RepID=A0A1I6Y9W5_9FLAO|nr:DUF4199 domain-containing protein [Lishizhenia tianjinensis]SFT47329.1 Protein of unknown function [Lishizhenia tianjinensis]
MRPALKYGLLFAAGWIVLKMIFKALGILQDDLFVPGLINNFFLLLAIAFGLYFEKKKEGLGNGTALSDIKNAMIAGTPYAVIVSVFIFFYYKDVSPEYVENRAQERIDMVYKAMQRPAYVDSLKMSDAKYAVMTNEEIYSEMKEGILSSFDTNFLLTFSLLGLIVLAVTYSIFTTVIFRKILLRDYYK